MYYYNLFSQRLNIKVACQLLRAQLCPYNHSHRLIPGRAALRSHTINVLLPQKATANLSILLQILHIRCASRLLRAWLRQQNALRRHLCLWQATLWSHRKEVLLPPVVTTSLYLQLQRLNMKTASLLPRTQWYPQKWKVALRSRIRKVLLILVATQQLDMKFAFLMSALFRARTCKRNKSRRLLTQIAIPRHHMIGLMLSPVRTLNLHLLHQSMDTILAFLLLGDQLHQADKWDHVRTPRAAPRPLKGEALLDPRFPAHPWVPLYQHLLIKKRCRRPLQLSVLLHQGEDLHLKYM